MTTTKAAVLVTKTYSDAFDCYVREEYPVAVDYRADRLGGVEVVLDPTGREIAVVMPATGGLIATTRVFKGAEEFYLVHGARS